MIAKPRTIEQISIINCGIPSNRFETNKVVEKISGIRKRIKKINGAISQIKPLITSKLFILSSNFSTNDLNILKLIGKNKKTIYVIT